MGLFNLLQSSFTSVVSVCAELLLVRRFLHKVLLISTYFLFLYLAACLPIQSFELANSMTKGHSFPVFTPQGSGKSLCWPEYLTFLCFSIYIELDSLVGGFQAWLC